MKIYSTGRALETGVITTADGQYAEYLRVYDPRFTHENEEAAMAHACRLRDAKVADLRRQADELEQMTFRVEEVKP